MRETIGSGSSTKILDFVYDNNGLPFALCYSTNNGQTFTDYFYVTNLQGDVVRLVNTSGETIANYEYDPWGCVLSVKNGNGGYITNPDHIGNINPLCYRGYYYDEETGWYYLQSRYYDPVIGRFINEDTLLSTDGSFLGCNAFAYCENNPINQIDQMGTFAITATVVAVGLLVAALCGVGNGLSTELDGGSFWGGFLVGFVAGGIGYSIVMSNPGSIGLALTGRCVSSFLCNSLNMWVCGKEDTLENNANVLLDCFFDVGFSLCFGINNPFSSGTLNSYLFGFGTDFLVDTSEAIIQSTNTRTSTVYGYYENNRGYSVSYSYSGYTGKTNKPTTYSYHEDTRGYPHSY